MGYIRRMSRAGIRELKNNLSRFLRRVAAGERILVTAHGRPIAELGPPSGASRMPMDAIRPPLEDGDPTEDWPVNIRLSQGTAAMLLDADRGEA